MIEINNLSFSYKNRQVLDNISLKIQRGTITAIVGDNGSGKSTLANLIAGLTKLQTEQTQKRQNTTQTTKTPKPQTNNPSILIDKTPIQDLTPKQLRQKTGVVFQNPAVGILLNTPKEDIEFICKNLQIDLDTDPIKSKLDALLTKFDLEKYYNMPTSKISFGNRQRFCILEALLTDPDYLVLDEPTSMLDSASSKNFLEMIKTLSPKIGILLVTNNLEDIRIADEVYVLSGTNLSDPAQTRDDIVSLLLNHNIPLTTYWQIAHLATVIPEDSCHSHENGNLAEAGIYPDKKSLYNDLLNNL